MMGAPPVPSMGVCVSTSCRNGPRSTPYLMTTLWHSKESLNVEDRCSRCIYMVGLQINDGHVNSPRRQLHDNLISEIEAGSFSDLNSLQAL